MALHKIFLNNEKKEGKIGMSTRYLFNPDKNELKVLWHGHEVSREAKPGDAFVVECNGGIPKIKKLKLPHSNAELIMWLCNYPKALRTHSKEEFEEKLKEQQKYREWWGYQEWFREGEKYAFGICNREDCGGVHHLVSYVAEDCTKEEFSEALRAYGKLRGVYYPKWFVENVLAKRLGINEVLDDIFF